MVSWEREAMSHQRLIPRKLETDNLGWIQGVGVDFIRSWQVGKSLPFFR